VLDDNQRTLEQTRLEVARATERYARITISPLEGGYGTTIGNALRRVMLSSLPGTAITSVRVSDVYHEFSVIPNAREDTTRLILNLKQVRFRPLGETLGSEWRLTVSVRGEGLVTAADIQLPPDLEVMNPEQALLTLDGHDSDLHMELMVQQGAGYSPAEERGKLAIGELPVDAIFSPVRRVAFNVTKTRVGQLADYDSLGMDIWTDGTIVPQDALREAARILSERFAFIAAFGGESVAPSEGAADGIPLSVYETAIEELDLSVRAYNCLKRAGLTRVGEILERMAQGDEDMLVIRNFGQKSLDELKAALRLKGYDEFLPHTDGGSAPAVPADEEVEEE
jgi:DNA-directed RNA polymerase subunit alpha